ncbi:MAG: cytochrome c biogenesis protein [Verrucomicrobiales bacterium]|nr:cytochrome c biogenesis protein [Verrucomicrobiales bacterium]
MDDWYLIISTLIFLVGFLLAVISLRRGRKGEVGLNFWLAAAGFIFQCLFLRERGELHGRCPITNGAEVLVFICWSVVILYLALGKAFRLSLLGVFSMPLVFVFQLIAIISLAANDPGPRPPETLDPWLEMHASMSLLAYGAYGLACIAGIMYLVQNRQLKSHEPGRLFYSLPPIKYLSDAIIRLLVIGTVLISVGIIAAFFMQVAPEAVHLAASGAVWLIYFVIVLVQFIRRISPKRLSVLAIGAFVFALVTLSVL